MDTHYPIDILHPKRKPLPLTINIGGELVTLDRTLVMGILNVTPDSFYAGSRSLTREEIEARVRRMIEDGADIIDVGACSTRPGSAAPEEAEEWERISLAMRVIRGVSEKAWVSVDTYRAGIAERAVKEYGAQIVNDVSGGTMDEGMFGTVAALGVPYVLTHIQGTPLTMQEEPRYEHVTVEVTQWLAERIDRLHQMGVCDVIIDPGFGFGKTLEQNYQLLRELRHLKHEIEAPLMVGLSRKSMICQPLGVTAEEALNGTTALNTIAIRQGADILRVHDVREAAQTVRLCELAGNT